MRNKRENVGGQQRGERWMGRGCRRLAAQEHECVQWPVRVEVSVQGFHVSVQGWGWGTRNQRPHLKEGEQIGLPIGPVSVPGWCARAEARSTCSPSSHSCPTLSGMVAMPAPWPPAWWHPNIDGHHRFTRGIRFNWKAGAPLGWGIPGPSRGPPRGSSWSGVGVGESPKAPSTVTPAGDRSVSGCWLSSCLRAPCCPEGLRRFWLRSQQNLKMMPVATRTMMMEMVIVT